MDQRLGTAQWADPEFVEAKFPYRDGSVWLGRAASDNDAPLGYSDDRHVCLVCGTRGGKGTSSIINNLCLWPGSIVVVDPKGENATITAARRGQGSEYCEGMGQKVYVLDPFGEAEVDPSYRARFNPLDAIRADDREALNKAAALADAIVVPEGDKNNYWEDTARQMIKALILHVATDEIYEGRRNLTTVRRLLSRGDWEAVEQLRAMGEKEIASAHQLLWTAVARNPAFEGRMADMGDELCTVMKDAPETYAGGFSQAKRNVEFLESFDMEDSVSQSDFQLSDLKTDPKGVSIYLSLPQRHMNTHHRWMRMIVGLLVAEMEKVKRQPACGHRILVLLDEFAGLERMKSIEKAVSQMAGYGLKMFFVLQSLEQLQAVYKDLWQTFLTNCGLKLFFSIDDNFSREYISKQMGDVEVIREVRSAGDNSSETQSESDSQSVSWSQTQSESMAESMSRGHSKSESSNWSTGKSVTHGENHSHSSSGTTTWSGLWPRPFGTKYSGPNSSYSSSSGSSWGTSTSETSSHSKGGSQGSSETLTEGVSHTSGSSTGETSGKTRGVTRGTTSGRTSGTAETVHRRPLCTMDEIGKLFARIDDRGHFAYPGLGLALISGQAPVIFRRVNYFEDIQFIGYFGPHPDHKMLPTARYKISPKQLEDFEDYFENSLSWVDKVREGAIVRAGDVVAYAKADKFISVRAPRDGRVVDLPYKQLKQRVARALPFNYPVIGLFQTTPMEVGYLEILHYVNGPAPVDPFADLAAHCRELEAERARLAREAAQKKADADRRRRIREQNEKNGRRLLILDRRKWWFKAAGFVSLAGLIDGGLLALNHATIEVLIALGAAGGLALCGGKIRQTFIDERQNEHPPQKPQRKLPSAQPALPTVAKASQTPPLWKSPLATGEEFLSFLRNQKNALPPGVSPALWKSAIQTPNNIEGDPAPQTEEVHSPDTLPPEVRANIDRLNAAFRAAIMQPKFEKHGKKQSINEMIEAHNRKFAATSDNKNPEAPKTPPPAKPQLPTQMGLTSIIGSPLRPPGLSLEMWKIANQTPEQRAEIDASIDALRREIEQEHPEKKGKKLSIDDLIEAHNRKVAPPSDEKDS